MVLDHPNERSLHQEPTPRGGGVGIVVPVSVAVALVGALSPGVRGAALPLMAIGLLVAGVGLLDDIRGLAAATRLLAHVFASALVVLAIGTWSTLAIPGLWSLTVGVAGVPLTMLWVVGLTNAYNFMDGIDGIAGSQGLVAGAGWTVTGVVLHDPLLAVAGAVVMVSCLGFLLFNWSPASIFMGDVGSGFLGFFLASLSVYTAPWAPAVAAAGILFVWPFVFDAVLTFLGRVRRRENLLSAHRSHLYQRLVLTGVSHRVVTLLYAGLAAAGVVAGLGVVLGTAWASPAGSLLVGALAATLWVGVRNRERSQKAGAKTDGAPA